jgi:hypothetical protein
MANIPTEGRWFESNLSNKLNGAIVKMAIIVGLHSAVEGLIPFGSTFISSVGVVANISGYLPEAEGSIPSRTAWY